jgi:hypothetical protein
MKVLVQSDRRCSNDKIPWNLNLLSCNIRSHDPSIAFGGVHHLRYYTKEDKLYSQSNNIYWTLLSSKVKITTQQRPLVELLQLHVSVKDRMITGKQYASRVMFNCTCESLHQWQWVESLPQKLEWSFWQVASSLPGADDSRFKIRSNYKHGSR